jgi:hypothetical protein
LPRCVSAGAEHGRPTLGVVVAPRPRWTITDHLRPLAGPQRRVEPAAHAALAPRNDRCPRANLRTWPNPRHGPRASACVSLKADDSAVVESPSRNHDSALLGTASDCVGVTRSPAGPARGSPGSSRRRGPGRFSPVPAVAGVWGESPAGTLAFRNAREREKKSLCLLPRFRAAASTPKTPRGKPRGKAGPRKRGPRQRKASRNWAYAQRGGKWCVGC